MISFSALLLVTAVSAATLDEAKKAIGQVPDCCSVLNSLLPGKVLVPETNAYNASIDLYWSGRVNDITPACTVLPGNAEEVSTAVKVLNPGFSASVKGCQFAIRSGGHTAFEGANNIEGGVTIDLGNLTTLQLSDDKSQAAVGPGLRWKEVYGPLQALNLTVMGGRSPSVGVGGLLLSGGLSYFASQYGMGIENILNMEVVLSSGKIVNANPTTNADLFKALKGGSNNFGIVTRFDIRVVPQGLGWGGTVIQTSFTNLLSQFPHIEHFTANTDKLSQLDFIFGWSGGREIIAPFLTYSDPVTEVPECFKNFTGYEGEIDNTRVAPLSDLVQDMYSADGRRQAAATQTFVNSAVMFTEYFTLFNATAQKLISTIPGMNFVASFQPLPLALSQVKNAPGNFLGLEEEDGDLVIVNNVATWDRVEDDDLVLGEMKKLNEAALERARVLGFYNGYIFTNTAEYWQNPFPGRGEENLRAMREISKKYDPVQLFQKAVPGGYKL